MSRDGKYAAVGLGHTVLIYDLCDLENCKRAYWDLRQLPNLDSQSLDLMPAKVITARRYLKGKVKVLIEFCDLSVIGPWTTITNPSEFLVGVPNGESLSQNEQSN